MFGLMAKCDRAPWEPASLALKVGDRVRVRLSGECRSWIHERRAAGARCDCAADGDEGIVRVIHDRAADPALLEWAGAGGHIYYAEFPHGGPRDGFCGSSFARAELERLP